MDSINDATYAFSHLAGQIRGEVHTDILRRTMLSTDASIFSKLPAAVVYPRSVADVQATVIFAAQCGLTLHPRGAGSGLCGSALGHGLVIDFSKFMNRLLHIDLAQGWFMCEPGYRLGELDALLCATGLFFPPDPSSGEYATFGGMCATNASGSHSVKYGNVADYLLDAEVVFADGTMRLLSQLAAMPLSRLPAPFAQLARLYDAHAEAIEAAYPPIRCNVAGFYLKGLVQDGRLKLHRLLTGSEGTLGVVTRLKFRLLPRPLADSLVVAFFDDIVSAARAVQKILPHGPSGIEVMDKSLLLLAREQDSALRAHIPENIDNVLLIEFDGPSAADCTRLAEETRNLLLNAGLTRKAHLALTAAEKHNFWALRKAAVPILYRLKGRKKILALVEDAAVPMDQLVPFFEGLYAIFKRHQVEFVLYGHIAKGLLHTRPLLDLKAPEDVRLLKILADEVFALVADLNGTVSGEHGDGRLRSAYVRPRYPQIYDVFEKVKRLLDPHGLLNPGIKIQNDPQQMTRDLRFGAGYHAELLPDLLLNWTDGFDLEAEKCHGCSKCTTLTTATRMCPVYKFTRDEAAAPKAKANILRALISGAVSDQALYAESFYSVMQLCINCGSCLNECPSNVNIPKLAMEAKAKYVRRFGTSLAEQLTARVETLARLTHRTAPMTAALLCHAPIKSAMARLCGLTDLQRPVQFARHSLFERLSGHRPGSGPAVLYYAGCYAGYIRPELGEAAVGALQHLGFSVHLPPQGCCGLPMLSKGLVDAAQRAVRRNLRLWQRLSEKIEHIVVTCSSCGYALMQDWGYLAGGRSVRQVAEKTIHISQLIGRHRDRLKWGHLPLTLAYHQPCHLRLQPAQNSSIELLKQIPGIDFTDLQSHCCGMAGSWGMIAKNAPLSRTMAAPMIQRLAGSGAHFGITDCPTCQMQMEERGTLPVRHPVEVVWQSLGSA
jgi:FAD/FMN-containing dehydrogenase/Fe-S oxidoreductase